MPATPSEIDVLPPTLPGFSSPVPVTVRIRNLAGVDATTYTTFNGSTAHPVAARITGLTSFFFEGGINSGPWVVTCTTDGGQVVANQTLVTGPTFNPAVVQCSTPVDADSSILAPAPLSVARYYVAGVGGAATVEAFTVDRAYAVPVDLDRPSRTLDRIGVSVSTAGSAGSVVRLGAYDTGADGLPGARIADFGTVDSATTGDKELTVNQVLTPSFGRRVWLVAAPQVAVPTLRALSLAHDPRISALTLGNVFTGGMLALQATGVSGALPTTYGTLAAAPRTQAPMIAYRFSA